MKSAAIYLYGLPGIDEPKAQKTVKYEEEKTLIAHLKELQSGYCEKGDMKPRINRITHPLTGKGIIECYSEADFRYVALLGMKIKPEANKPIEILN